MNLKPGNSVKTKTATLENGLPSRKLRLNIRPIDTQSTGKRRSCSVYSNNSSISGNTVITRQTIRTEINKRKETKRIEDFLSDSKGINLIEGMNLKQDSSREMTPNFKKKNQPIEDTKNDLDINLESISEVSEDVNKFLDHLKQTWFYFFMMSFKLFKVKLNFIFSLFYYLMALLMKILVVVVQLIVIVMLLVYFLISYLIPDRKRTPFVNRIKYEHIALLDVIEHNNRVLYLDLDNTLIYCTKTKPKTKGYTTIYVKSVDDNEAVTYYMYKRPYLEEFLREVSL